MSFPKIIFCPCLTVNTKDEVNDGIESKSFKPLSLGLWNYVIFKRGFTRFNIFLYVGLVNKFEIYKSQNRRFQQYQ